MPARPPSPKLRRLELIVRTVSGPPDSETAFVGLFGEEATAFWLDSSRHPSGRARFSYMGAGGGPLATLLSHDAAAGELTLSRRGRRETHRGGLLDWLERSLAELSPEDAGLPFDFTGGFVGYLGYELKVECGSPLAHRSPHPDAMLLFADRLIAYDHAENEAHVVCLTEAGARREAALWADETARRLRSLRAAPAPAPPPPARGRAFFLTRGADDYLRDIEACQRHLAAGESYEICLTNELNGPRCTDALSLHRVLRRVNPAPFAAFLRLGGVEVLSSSPGALPGARPRRRARGEADQGNRGPRRDAARGPRGGSPPAVGGQGSRREPDDRRRPAQRSRAGRRDRLGAGANADGRRELRDRPPAGLDRARSPAP